MDLEKQLSQLASRHTVALKEFEKLNTELQNILAEIKDTEYPKADSKFLVIGDFGHGGLNQEGKYTTNGKFFTHSKSEMHRNGNFYEGVSNRVIGAKFMHQLRKLGIRCKEVAHAYYDTPLPVRSRRINDIHEQENGNTFGFSFHSNAVSNDPNFVNDFASGIQYHTSRGKTKSDAIATKLYEVTDKAEFVSKYQIPVRRYSWKKDDYDFENNFHILSRTAPPMVLSENLFFDNYKDALLLMNPEVQEGIAKIHSDVVVWCQDNI